MTEMFIPYEPQTRAKIAVRTHAVGWQIVGRDGQGRRVRITFEHESAARRTAEKMRADRLYVLTTEDFDV